MKVSCRILGCTRNFCSGDAGGLKVSKKKDEGVLPESETFLEGEEGKETKRTVRVETWNLEVSVGSFLV